MISLRRLVDGWMQEAEEESAFAAKMAAARQDGSRHDLIAYMHSARARELSAELTKYERLVEVIEPLAKYGDTLSGQRIRGRLDEPLVQLWDHKITARDLIAIYDALKEVRDE